ncbi:MAG TPA: cyanophycinase [Candidatus Angelobacter sp.]
MRRTSIILIFFATICGIRVLAQAPATAGPARGTLVLDGGRAEGFIRRAAGFFPANAGALPDSATCSPHRPLDPELSRLCRIATNRSDVIDKFVELAGGSGARIVVIPTAWNDKFDDGSAAVTPDHLQRLRIGVQKTMGVDRVTILHTRDRRQADSPEFVAPLKRATGVWIDGGNDANLWDAYLGTRVETEIKALLARGGVVAGSSAGAAIQGSLGLVFTIVDSPGGKTLRVDGTHMCFGLLTNSTVMPHWNQRDRPDLTPVVVAHPSVLGIGIDVGAAAIVQGNRLEVTGDGHVGIYDGKVHGDKSYYYLSPGDRFDLHTRSSTEVSITIDPLL